MLNESGRTLMRMNFQCRSIGGIGSLELETELRNRFFEGSEYHGNSMKMSERGKQGKGRDFI